MPFDFSSAELKLGRARVHLDNAQAISERFISNNFKTVTKRQDRQGRHVIELAALVEPPPDLALAIGDAASCLRATLDHIAYECATKPLTCKEEEKVAFPLCSSRKKWLSARDRSLGKLPKRAVALIHRFQPYHYRKEPNTRFLRVLQSVNNWDKHRRVALTGSRAKRIEYTFSRPELIASVVSHVGNLKVGTVLLRFALVPGATRSDVNVKFKTIIVPSYSPEMPKEVVGASAVNELISARNFIVSNVLPAFRAL